MDGSVGSIAVTHLPQRQSLRVTIRFPGCISTGNRYRVRRLFDVGADIETIDAHFSHDPNWHPGWRCGRACGRRAAGMALSWRCGLSSGSRSAWPPRAGSQDNSSPSTANRYRTVPANHPGLLPRFPRRSVSRRQSRSGWACHAACKRCRRWRGAQRAIRICFGRLGPLKKRLCGCARSGIGEWTAQYIALRAIVRWMLFQLRTLAYFAVWRKWMAHRPLRRVFFAVRNRGGPGVPMQHNICGPPMLTQIASVEGTYA